MTMQFENCFWTKKCDIMVNVNRLHSIVVRVTFTYFNQIKTASVQSHLLNQALYM